MIELKNITIAYENIVAVKDISLRIEKGSLVGIVGPNGAGKSSLLEAMVGIISQFNGQIIYEDLHLQKQRFKMKQKLGYAPENVDLMPYLTGREYLEMIADIRQLSGCNDQIEKMIRLLNMEAKQNDLIIEYSHGMKQKISVAGAMIGYPPIIIFDEALNGFDPLSLYNLKTEIENHVASGAIVILSSHILELIEKWCTQIIIMNEGKIFGNYKKSEIEKLIINSGKDFNTFFRDLISEA